MSVLDTPAGFQQMLDGVSRLGCAKGLVDVCAKLIEEFAPGDLPPGQQRLFQQVVKAVLRHGIEERDAALAILGEQGIDARQMLAGIESAMGRVPDVD